MPRVTAAAIVAWLMPCGVVSSPEERSPREADSAAKDTIHLVVAVRPLHNSS